MEARHGASAAQSRLIRRSWEIYKAFVLTGVLDAGLRLAAGAGAGTRAGDPFHGGAGLHGASVQHAGRGVQRWRGSLLSPTCCQCTRSSSCSRRWQSRMARAMPLTFVGASALLWLMAPMSHPAAAEQRRQLARSFNPFALATAVRPGPDGAPAADIVLPRQALVRLGCDRAGR
ncbi:hypothetical protein ACU4GD_37880 [Cupriavidus basilensis]